MLSTARAVFRPFLIAIVLAVCVCPLHLRAQETSSACQIGEAAPLAGLFMAAAGPAQPSRRINPKILCGGAGQTCCIGGQCGSGLICNSSGYCRACGGSGNLCCADGTCSEGLTCTNGRCAAPPPPPCGGVDQACCAGATCNTLGLACNLIINQCQPCGYYGTYCCPYTPTCFEGSCQGQGICLP
jgi:hypothetical protein